MDQKLMDVVLDKISSTQNITGHSFNLFFKEIKGFMQNGGLRTNGEVEETFTDHLKKIDKKDIIIFSPNMEELEKMPEIKTKILFPFEKIFIEFPMIQFHKDSGGVLKYTNGFFIDAIKNDKNEILNILFVSIWLDYGTNPNNKYDEGVTPRIILLPYHRLNKEATLDRMDLTESQQDMVENVLKNLKKICYLIQSNKYSEYYKWTPKGIVSKEIVYSHDVKSHKRHFWKDSGRFIIPHLPKEEILERGYGIDDLVFRGYEVRRDVPYKIIGSFKVGGEKEKRDSQRIINILKKRIWRNENKLGLIISKIFVSHNIRKNDRKIIGPLELDFYIHDLKLGFEYDGEQHYDKKVCEEVFKSDFKSQQQRDVKKNAVCRKKKITLIRIKYDEPLTVRHIKDKIKEKGIYYDISINNLKGETSKDVD